MKTPEQTSPEKEFEAEKKNRDVMQFSTPFGEEIIINMGPQHPSTHGVLRLVLKVQGELITEVDPIIGYLHRCFEKHAENIDYQGVIPFLDRMDYVAAMNNEWGYALAVEKLMDIKIPERVEYIRIIVGELQRIASHLLGIGTYALDIGSFTPFMYAFRDREKFYDLFECLCGARLLYNYICIGGVYFDLPEGWLDDVKRLLDYIEPRIDEMNKMMTSNEIMIRRSAEVGVLSEETCYEYALTGPNLRGSGVKWDLRKDETYSIYDRFEFDVPVGLGKYGTLGSCWDRYWVRILEMRESAKIVRQAMKDIPDGDVSEGIPKRIAPKGEVYFRSEAPRGELGFYVVGDGGKTPYRVKGRSPGFCSLSALPKIGPGNYIADAVATVGSLDFTLGEVDR